MEPKDIWHLDTIVEYCEDILDAVERHGNDLESLEKDLEFQYVCSFLLIQIGEQVNSLSTKFIHAHPEVPWRDIVSMRNILTHNYGKVSNKTIYETITDNIPGLLEFCKKQISR